MASIAESGVAIVAIVIDFKYAHSCGPHQPIHTNKTRKRHQHACQYSQFTKITHNSSAFARQMFECSNVMIGPCQVLYFPSRPFPHSPRVSNAAMEQYAKDKEAAIVGSRYCFHPVPGDDEMWEHAFKDGDEDGWVLSTNNRTDPLFIQAVTNVDGPTKNERRVEICVEALPDCGRCVVMVDRSKGVESLQRWNVVPSQVLEVHMKANPTFLQDVLEIMSATGTPSLANLKRDLLIARKYCCFDGVNVDYDVLPI
jgi:hypothetical protein